MEHRDLNDFAAIAAIAQAGSITGAAKIDCESQISAPRKSTWSSIDQAQYAQ